MALNGEKCRYLAMEEGVGYLAMGEGVGYLTMEGVGYLHIEGGRGGCERRQVPDTWLWKRVSGTWLWKVSGTCI